MMSTALRQSAAEAGRRQLSDGIRPMACARMLQAGLLQHLSTLGVQGYDEACLHV